MSKILVIGTGAAGNKAAINLIEKKIMSKEDILLVNSSMTDIKNLGVDESEYMDCYVNLYDGVDGCGKERGAAGTLTLSSFAKDTFNLKSKIIKNGYDKVIIVTSIEGGTGSGSTPIIAAMINNEFNKEEPTVNIEIVAFKGFGKDLIGLQNSAHFFMELDEYLGNNYVLQVIRNDAFLKDAKNQLEAQKMANDEFAKRISIITGQLLNNGNDNDCTNIIDGSDLYKNTFSFGYSTVEYIEIENKIVSRDDYNDLINKMIDSSKSASLDECRSVNNDKIVTKVSLIANIQKSSRNHVDDKHTVLKERFGELNEMYDQIYSDPNRPEFIALIISGLKRPTSTLTEITEEYQKRTKNIDTSEDNYSETLKSMKSIMGNKGTGSSMIRNMNVFNKSLAPADTKVSDDFLDCFRVGLQQMGLNSEEATSKKSRKTIRNNNDLLNPKRDESDF